MTHDHYMRLALAEAEQALAENEVPVGAVIVQGERVIASAHNQREMRHDPTAHAEMIAITQAAGHLGDWRLAGCTLYVTLEPCTMCCGAIVQARIPTVVYGATDPKAGACGSRIDIPAEPWLNHHLATQSGLLADECGGILTAFFETKRAGAAGKD